MTTPSLPGIDDPAAPPRGLRILELVAENVKRIEVVEIRPDGNVVEIVGLNGSGKTSVLDAIWWALAGASNIQAEPIRRGAKEAMVRLDLGEFIVVRTFHNREGGITTSLSVQSREGAEYRSPQKVLDGFLGALSLDPLAFMRMDAKGQFATLRAFVPDFDFEHMENMNAGDATRRREINAEHKRQVTLAERMVVVDEDRLPAAPIDEDALVAEIEAIVRENGEINLRRERRERAVAEIAGKNARCAEIAAQIEALHDQIGVLRADWDALLSGVAEIERKLTEAPALPETVDAEPVRRRLTEAKGINTRLDIKRQRDQARAEAAETKKLAEGLSAKIEARLQDAAARIAAAEMPIAGLTLTTKGEVLFDGLPFDQGSDAGQLRASIAIAMALSPKLKVIRVRDGSLLDQDGMRLLAEMADAADCQVWIERVATDSPVGFEMVAGRLRQREDAEAAP